MDRQHTLMRMLEPAMDTYGLREVLNALAQICAEKADHIATNWQPLGPGDREQIKAWKHAASRVERITVYTP